MLSSTPAVPLLALLDLDALAVPLPVGAATPFGPAFDIAFLDLRPISVLRQTHRARLDTPDLDLDALAVPLPVGPSATFGPGRADMAAPVAPPFGRRRTVHVNRLR